MSGSAASGPLPPASDSALARAHPRLFLGLHGVIGLALATACMWLFFAIADEVPEHGAMVRVDGAVTLWLQVHGTETGETIFVWVSYLGAQVLIALIVATAVVLAARRAWRALIVLAVTCGGGALLNVTLKTIFHRARPLYASEFHVTSWSFPSGHAMDSLVIYGLFAYWLARRRPRARAAIFGIAAVLIGSIGFARIYLGVHYLSDVIAGFSAGAVWLGVSITGYNFAERRRREL